MRDDLKNLIELQKIDMVIQNLQAKRASFPLLIQKLESEISGTKNAVEAAKKELTEKQLERKNIDMELQSIEAVIRKHQTELNAVKSNDAYRALLKEIDLAKEEKDKAESKFLLCLEEIDAVNKRITEETQKAQNAEIENKEHIARVQQEGNDLDTAITEEEKKRAEIAGRVTPLVLRQYDKIRVRRAGIAIVEIRESVCLGCNMEVMPRQIDDVLLDKEIALCEHCGRILYVEEKNAAGYRKKA